MDDKMMRHCELSLEIRAVRHIETLLKKFIAYSFVATNHMWLEGICVCGGNRSVLVCSRSRDIAGACDEELFACDNEYDVLRANLSSRSGNTL